MATSILGLSSERAAETGAEPDDLRLVEALREGSERAYEDLIGRFQQPVYTLALRLLNDQSEACDVVQEVFLKVFRNVGSFRGQSTLKPDVHTTLTCLSGSGWKADLHRRRNLRDSGIPLPLFEMDAILRRLPWGRMCRCCGN